MKDIFAVLLDQQGKNADTVLCVITGGHGSSPRKKGSLMLVGKNGCLAGSVGGGAIEYEVQRQASAMILSNTSFLLKDYILNKAGDLGMVCGGSVTVLFILLKAADPAAVKLAKDVLTAIREKCPGTLSFFSSSLPVLNAAENTGAKPELILPLPIGERAILFGGGHISAALCPLLTSVGFRVTVMDCRPEYAAKERFVSAERVICAPYDNISSVLTITPEDYIVVMTNGHLFDQTVQEQILRLETAYVGAIGSKPKIKAINEMLRKAGISEEKLAFVHSPIGTPIKAVTPEEIAVSIAGEMILVRASRREASGEFVSHGCPMH